MKLQWRSGNRLQLLENGEQFFPAVFEAIEQAQHELILETFILADDVVGRRLQAVLIAAAQRGVRIDVTVDGFGSGDLPPAFVAALTDAGVRFHVYDPQPKRFGMRTNLLHRLHRKIVAIDGRCAFIGGINYIEDQLAESGPKAKQDYAMRIDGPLAEDVQRFALTALARPLSRWQRWRHWRPAGRGESAPDLNSAQAALVSRDNEDNRDRIERCYRAAIRSARTEVLIANAYFFPGFRLLRDLRRAARRGVHVELILQGEPDAFYVRTVARMLYHPLIKDGVRIYEYCRRPLHGKVAVFDDEWSTVGSSNLDPWSLSLNLEANVFIRDRAFAAELRERLRQLKQHCQRIEPESLPNKTMWRYTVGALAYHLARHFPSWLRLLPRREPQLVQEAAQEAAR